MMPPMADPALSIVEELAALMRGRRTLVLSGAGISTESGIPDYRGPRGTLRAADGEYRRPMLYREFVATEGARRRYWARSALGWERVREARPNAGHRAVADLEDAGHVNGVITQNVDGLHQAAGSRRVLELHGSLSLVKCLDCGREEDREHYQERLVSFNPVITKEGAASPLPDGDADLDAAGIESLVVPGCLHCGGVLKPGVVFFGENVPRETVGLAGAMLAESEVLLVVGSSLIVSSGFRLVERASREGKPVAIVNGSETRGDPMVAIRIESRLGDVLPKLASALGPDFAG
jgi:NAD-dependent deacetylase sirtuin 4